MPTPSTPHSTGPPPQLFDPGTPWIRILSLVTVGLGVLVTWAGSSPPMLWPWDPAQIGRWIGNPTRITESYAVLIAGLLWPYWLRRYWGTPRAWDQWGKDVVGRFGVGIALVFATAQVAAFLITGQWHAAGFGDDTALSLLLAVLVMFYQLLDQSVELAKEAFAVAPTGTVDQVGSGPPPISVPAGAAAISPSPPATVVPPAPVGPTVQCSICGSIGPRSNVFCGRCGTHTSPDPIGFA